MTKQVKSMTAYLNEEFPSEYLNGDEIGKAIVPVKIASVDMKLVKNPKKQSNQNRMVIYFEDKEKGLIIAKERGNELKILFGDDPQKYIGEEIMLYTKRQNSFGEMKNIIHIRGVDVVPDYAPGEEQPAEGSKKQDEEEVNINDIPF